MHLGLRWRGFAGCKNRNTLILNTQILMIASNLHKASLQARLFQHGQNIGFCHDQQGTSIDFDFSTCIAGE